MDRQERIALAIRRMDQAERTNDEESLRYMLEDAKGRWMLMRLYERCHMDGPLDAGNILMEEGERRVALSIDAAIKAAGGEALERLYQARDEYDDFHKKRRQAVENARGSDDDDEDF